MGEPGAAERVPAHFLQGAVCHVGSLAGVVVDASTEVLVGFPRTTANAAPLPNVGRAAQASILLQDGRPGIEVSMTATRRVDSPAEVILVGFRPNEPLPDLLRRSGFELRGERRVTPAPGQASLVNIHVGSGFASGFLADVSMSGIGVVADPDSEARLAGERAVRLEIYPPGSDDAVNVDSAIQHRRLLPSGHVLYGLRFLVDDDSPLPLGIVRYVLSRRKEV